MKEVLPENFINSLEGLQGFDRECFINAHCHTQPITSIRLNPGKPSFAVIELPIQDIVPWCAEGRYLRERPSFTMDPVFHGGAYYVQEASSMFLDYVIKELYKNATTPKRVLDLCAAPGGKSTLLAAALPDSFIISNEVIKTRVGPLAENISKWGCSNVIVTNNDPGDFKKLEGYFDLVVVDAPCSGSGLFRKDTEAIGEWSRANVELCSLRQQRILSDIIGTVKTGGHLIYSTCSYSQQEDEDICDWLVDTFGLQPVKISINSSWGIIETLSRKHKIPGYRFYPDKVRGEGFFIACFKQEAPTDEFSRSSLKVPVASKVTQEIAKQSFKSAEEYTLSDEKEIIIASPKKWEQEMATAGKVLNLKKSGIAVGTIKGKDFIPHHELALSGLLPDNITAVNLTKEDALKYLKRQDLVLDTYDKGWVICRYAGINIGWIKVLPNRVNNYYPTNWRILKV